MKIRASGSLLFYFGSLSAASFAQTGPPTTSPPTEIKKNQAAREDGDVELSIGTTKSSFVAGEPLVLDILFKNVSGEPFWFHSFIEHNEAQLNGFVVTVTNSLGDELPLLPQRHIGGRSRGVYTLQPEQVLHDGMIINNLVDISRPDTYAIRVKWKYHNLDKVVQSNVLKVIIAYK